MTWTQWLGVIGYIAACWLAVFAEWHWANRLNRRLSSTDA